MPYFDAKSKGELLLSLVIDLFFSAPKENSKMKNYLAWQDCEAITDCKGGQCGCLSIKTENATTGICRKEDKKRNERPGGRIFG